MALQRWRIWQWVLVALVAGAALGFVVTRESSDEVSAQSMSVSQFITQINTRTENGGSVLTDIVVFPPRMGALDKPIQKVTFREMRRHRESGRWDAVAEWWMAAPIPFTPGAPRPDYRVTDFLADKAKQIPSLKYKYAWWEVASMPDDTRAGWWQRAGTMFGLTVGASVLLIGILWPLTIRMLVRMGFGDPAIQEEAGVDLSKIRGASTEPPLVSAGKESMAEQEQRLTALNAELEAKLGGMNIDASGPDEAAEIEAEEAAIRKLDGMRVEPIETATTSDDPKDFSGGEFYPVARQGQKKST